MRVSTGRKWGVQNHCLATDWSIIYSSFHTANQNSKLCYYFQIDPESIAGKDGQILEGDQLLQVCHPYLIKFIATPSILVGFYINSWSKKIRELNSYMIFDWLIFLEIQICEVTKPNFTVKLHLLYYSLDLRYYWNFLLFYLYLKINGVDVQSREQAIKLFSEGRCQISLLLIRPQVLQVLHTCARLQ